MDKTIVTSCEHRNHKITVYEEYDHYEYEGVFYSYEIRNPENRTWTDQTDEYWLDNEDIAVRKAMSSIDNDLDVDWIVSCQATKKTLPHQSFHFPLLVNGTEQVVRAFAEKELEKRYPHCWHSIIVKRAKELH